MTAFKHLATAVALTLVCALLTSAQEQTPSIDVTTDSNEAQFAVAGQARRVRVEIFSPSGELVFESEALSGQSVRWNMRNERNERAPDGLYLATITVTDSAGKRRKRIEQITVGSEMQPRQLSAASAPPPDQAVGPINGEGNAGMVALFTGTNAIGNSSMKEQDTKIGINRGGNNANAQLHVESTQPAPAPVNGTNATDLFLTSGGKGGNTTSSGTTAGQGANVRLLAGNGGNAIAGSTNGSGGNITLQPGSAGTGGTGGAAGNVLLAPSAVGNVGIRASNPFRTLQIGPGFDSAFGLEPSNGSPNAGYIRFGDSTGWKLHIARSREFSGGPLNNGTTGVLMTIQDNGRVGIGTTTPSATLQVNGHTDLNTLSVFDGLIVSLDGQEDQANPLCIDNVIFRVGFCSSSLRYKTGVTHFIGGLDLIDRLRPVSFTWKRTGKHDIGLAAEEVEEVEPLLTFRNGRGEIEGVRYNQLSAVFINAFKEQQAQLQQQQKLIERLQSRLTRLERVDKKRRAEARSPR